MARRQNVDEFLRQDTSAARRKSGDLPGCGCMAQIRAIEAFCATARGTPHGGNMTDGHLYEWRRDDETEALVISTDHSRLDIDVIHGFLTHSYWVPGIPRDVVQQSIDHSLCFGLYASRDTDAAAQVGFARVVTDFSRMAHVLDVFVLPSHRRRGLGKWLVQCMVECPALQGLQSMTLATADAHELYRRFGFTTITNPGVHMRRTQEMAWHRPEQVHP
jgi:GNAT superfamily N-acetyltransferase